MNQFQLEYRKILPHGSFLVSHLVVVAKDIPHAAHQFWAYVDSHITQCPVHLMDVVNLTEMGCAYDPEDLRV